MMKPTPQASDLAINPKPKKKPVKKIDKETPPDKKTKVSARNRIEEIKAQQEWEKEWGI
ncbi:hypothetical protein L4D77_27535 [Photobacterium frigidiphilum]|uniref:hypothetical protein n=1 Tax=Photobacterium frigidiphilum TaxID=264736 RepID=UPI003D0FFC91